MDAVLLAADPPDHTAVRRLVAPYFGRDVVERLAAFSAERAAALLASASPGLDVVHDYAEPLSEAVAQQLLGCDDPTVDAIRDAARQAVSFTQFTAALDALADRSGMYGRLRGDGLDDAQARSLVRLFWLASTKTTERTIAQCVLQLLHHPAIREAIEADDALVAPYIEEVTRLHQPEPMLRRQTTQARSSAASRFRRPPRSCSAWPRRIGTHAPTTPPRNCSSGARDRSISPSATASTIASARRSGAWKWPRRSGHCCGMSLGSARPSRSTSIVRREHDDPLHRAFPHRDWRRRAAWLAMRLGPLDAMDPHDYVMHLALGHVAARAVFALVQLRVPDHLMDRPQSAAELATLTGVHAGSLLRLLRASTALDLCLEDTDQRFSLTSAGKALRTGAPRHAASAIRQIGNAPMWTAFGEFLHSVTTGEPALARAGGAPLFSGLSAEQAARVSEAMVAYYGHEPAAVAVAYDFSGIGTLVDIGGSTGHLLTTLLGAAPGLRGIVYDLPALAEEATRWIAARGFADRCTFVGGSFFESVPPGGDAYLLSHVLNDWPDDTCRTILQHVRRVIPRRGRLLIVEQPITPDGESDRAKLLDLISLTASGGRHRTQDEHAALLAAAGFALTRVVPTRADVSVIEARPV